MATIKEGYNGKPTTIRISAQENGSIELWIEETGMENPKAPTLSYMTVDELYQLYKEVKAAGRDLFD